MARTIFPMRPTAVLESPNFVVIRQWNVDSMEKIFYLLRVEYEGSINEHTIHYLRVGFPEFGIGGRAVEPDIQSMDDMFEKTINIRSWVRTPDEEEIYAQIHALHNLTSYKLARKPVRP